MPNRVGKVIRSIEFADLYDRYRPTPPIPVVEALINVTDIGTRTG